MTTWADEYLTMLEAADGRVLSEMLGPLPPQVAWAVCMHGECVLFATNAERKVGMAQGATMPLFGAAQMRDYAAQAVARAVALMLSEPTEDALRAGIRACKVGANGPRTLADWRDFYVAVASHSGGPNVGVEAAACGRPRTQG